MAHSEPGPGSGASSSPEPEHGEPRDWRVPSVLEQSATDARANRAIRRRWLIGGAAVIIVALLVALVLWLVRSPIGIVAGAVAATVDQGSARTNVTSTLGGVPLLGGVELAVADGEVDFSSGEAVLRRRIVGGVGTELRYDTEGVFVQVPVADDRWVRLAEGVETPQAAGDDLVSVVPGIANPAAILGMLRVVDSEPRELREELVGDVPVTVYEVVVNLDTAAGMLGADAASVVTRLRRLAGGGELPLQLGIDEDGLIRSVRFTTEVQLPAPITPRLENMLTFHDFGVDVDVRPPAPEQIVDMDPGALARLDPLAALRDLLSDIPGL